MHRRRELTPGLAGIAHCESICQRCRGYRMRLGDLHAGIVEFFIFLEPFHHFVHTRENQCILVGEMREPEVADFIEECRGEGLLEFRDCVRHGW